MADERKLRVFLSYTHADITPIRKLYENLSNEGFEVWFDEESLIPGQEWKSEIEKALENSDVVIVCLSNNSVSKEGFVQREFKFALDKTLEMTEDGIFLIPVRLEECKVPQKLSRYHWVDLFMDNGLKRLIKALSLRLSQVSGRESNNLNSNTFISEQGAKEKISTVPSLEIKPETKKDGFSNFAQKNKETLKEVGTAYEKATPSKSPYQEKKLESITMSRWRSTFSPTWIAVPIGIFLGFIVDSISGTAFGAVGIGISLSLAIISITFIQWNLLYKYFLKVDRLFVVNFFYIISSAIVDYFLAILFAWSITDMEVYTRSVYVNMSLFFLVSFSLWLIISYLIGVAITKKNALMEKFLGGVANKV